MTNLPGQELSFLSNEERLNVYNLLTEGCTHVWSKKKLQEQKLQTALNIFIPLTQLDPYFLAHLTSYLVEKTKVEDFILLSIYANSLSSADGQAFSPDSKYKKPNLRYVSWAALQKLSPIQAVRLMEISRNKFSVANHLNLGQHFPTTLKKAFQKYLKYREANLSVLRGIRKAGLADKYKTLYENLRLIPSDEAASILRIKIRGRNISFEDSLFDFKDKTDLEIAEMIRKNKLPVLSTIGALPKMSPVVAVALLEQASGDQAVILRKVFEDAGVLKDKEVLKLYEEKILTAKTALDRVEKFQKQTNEDIARLLKTARATVRKEQVGDIGKIYMMIDASGSMDSAIKFAMQKASIFAECVNNPRENFRWGMFDTRGEELPLPEEFVQDAFKAVLFGRRFGGGTDIAALYRPAREFGADVDVIVSDGEHNSGYLNQILKNVHNQNPNFSKPKACVFINFGAPRLVEEAYNGIGVPVAIVNPSSLESSAGVTDAVRLALKGPMQVIEDIMDHPLLELPKWYYSI